MGVNGTRLTNSLHTHLSANIPALVDGKPATVSISPGDQYGKGPVGPATYEVPSSYPLDAEPQFDLQLAEMSNWQSEGTGVVSILTDDGKRVTGTVAGTINYTSRATINGHWAEDRATATRQRSKSVDWNRSGDAGIG